MNLFVFWQVIECTEEVCLPIFSCLSAMTVSLICRTGSNLKDKVKVADKIVDRIRIYSYGLNIFILFTLTILLDVNFKRSYIALSNQTLNPYAAGR